MRYGVLSDCRNSEPDSILQNKREMLEPNGREPWTTLNVVAVSIPGSSASLKRSLPFSGKAQTGFPPVAGAVHPFSSHGLCAGKTSSFPLTQSLLLVADHGFTVDVLVRMFHDQPLGMGTAKRVVNSTASGERRHNPC